MARVDDEKVTCESRLRVAEARFALLRLLPFNELVSPLILWVSDSLNKHLEEHLVHPA